MITKGLYYNSNLLRHKSKKHIYVNKIWIEFISTIKYFFFNVLVLHRVTQKIMAKLI